MIIFSILMLLVGLVVLMVFLNTVQLVAMFSKKLALFVVLVTLLFTANAFADVEVCSKAKDFNGCMNYFAQEENNQSNTVIENMMPHLTKGFYDPGSVEVSNLVMFEFESGYTLITGKINAKNRMGGYVGILNFVYTVKGLGKNPMRKGLFKAVAFTLTEDNGVLMDSRSGDMTFEYAGNMISVLNDWSEGGEEWLVSGIKEKKLPKFKQHYLTAYGTLNGPTATKYK